MNYVEQLFAEHVSVVAIIKIMEKMVEKMKVGREIDYKHFDAIIDFLKIFVDKCHHGKEENLLFPAMIKAGILEKEGHVEALLKEHEQGRTYVRKMAENLKNLGQHKTDLMDSALAYGILLLAHIQTENMVVFPLSQKRIPQAEQNKLLEGFDKIEEEVIGHGKHEQYHELIHQLSHIYLS